MLRAEHSKLVPIFWANRIFFNLPTHIASKSAMVMSCVTRCRQIMKRDAAMTTNIYDHTAKIYRFPAGGKAGIGERREQMKSIADLKPQQFADAAAGSGWYHEAAIQEAERARKR
jgi:hypothetical protein